MLPSTFNIHAAGGCMIAARILAGQLVEDHVENVNVVEGFIQFIDEDGSSPEDLKFTHTWIMVNDEAIDPTFSQFSEYSDYYSYNREILEVIPAEKYLAEAILNTDYPQLFFSDGVIPPGIEQYLRAVITKLKVKS